MLMLRRLHSDLSEGGGSPRHGGYRAAPAPVAAGAEGGGIIDSALTPLTGAVAGMEGLGPSWRWIYGLYGEIYGEEW